MKFLKHNLLLLLIVNLCFSYSLLAQDFVMQGWYWDYPKTADGFLWADTIKMKAAEIKNAGFTYVWLPPLSRASFGNSSNGYDPQDLYDLGEYGLGPTGFGTRADVDALITQFNNVGLKAAADVVYNHRDGGKSENNPALKNYIDSYDWTRANTGYNPFPYDRYRVILPIGGTSGNVAGDYYFKLSSVSGHNRFNNFQYNVYMQTNKKGWQNLTPLTESEPNGGGDCSQPYNDIQLGRDMNAVVDDPSTCRTDEFHLLLTSDDYYASGDTIFIYFGKRNSDYSDVRIYGIWSAPRNQNIVNEIIYQTYTDFTSMPSGLGAMNFENFKPNSTNPTKLDGDWDWLWFFYDYDQNIPSTKTSLFDWTRWLWNNVGIRGFRMDAVKHFPPEFVGDLLDNLHSNGINPGLVVGEFYDANSSLLKSWIDDVYNYMDTSTKLAIIPRVFDFSLRDALEKASDQFGYDVRNVFNANIVDAQGLSGFNVVTFVNNHDFRYPGQAVDNDPILAYAYILTNNQIGIPCVFYPDYYYVSSFSNTGMKNKIDELINVHKQFIYGSSARDYLTRFGTPYNPVFSSGYASTTLVYQLMNTPSGNDVIVAINYAGEPLDMWVGINTTGVAEGANFGDKIGNGLLSTLTVSSGRVNIKLPARSYAVWVENEAPVPVELISFSAKHERNNVLLTWETSMEVNNYGFEIEKSSALNSSFFETDIEWAAIGFIGGAGNSNSTHKYSFADNNISVGKYAYRLKQIDADGSFSFSRIVYVEIENLELKFALEQNYPNPFNPSTKIRYSIPRSTEYYSVLQNVTLKVYDILGNEVATLVNEEKPAGTYEVEFSAESFGNASGLTSGIYFYRLQAGSFTETKKMILMR